MQNVDRLRTAWVTRVALAALLAPLTSAAADVSTIECRESFDIDDNHNVVIAYEIVEVPMRYDAAGANELRLKLEEDYKRALQDHPPAGTEGARVYWAGTGCKYETHLEDRTGSIANGYGATTTFVRTDVLRGGKGYLASGAPKPKPKPPKKDVTLNKPALVIEATPADTPKGWTPQQIAQAREASEAKAKALLAMKRNDAELQAEIKKRMDELRKRGRAQ